MQVQCNDTDDVAKIGRVVGRYLCKTTKKKCLLNPPHLSPDSAGQSQPNLAELSEEQRNAYLEEDAKRAKRNHKIFLLSKGNGLMTPQDKNFITRIQLQQLVAALPQNAVLHAQHQTKHCLCTSSDPEHSCSFEYFFARSPLSLSLSLSLLLPFHPHTTNTIPEVVRSSSTQMDVPSRCHNTVSSSLSDHEIDTRTR